MSGVSGKIVAFWKEMAREQSPLRLAHPPEHRLYGHLASATSSCGEFVLFCRVVESGLAACLSVGGRRKPDTRSVLVGQTLRRLRSSVEHRALLVDLANVLCKAVQFSEGDAVISAVMASTVVHVWNDRGRKEDSVQASSVATFPQLSVQEQEKVAYHVGWTFKRVRDHLLVSKQQLTAQGRSGPVHCTSTDLLLLLGALGEDRLGQNGKYLVHVEQEVAEFFEYLHGLVQGLFADKVGQRIVELCAVVVNPSCL